MLLSVMASGYLYGYTYTSCNDVMHMQSTASDGFKICAVPTWRIGEVL